PGSARAWIRIPCVSPVSVLQFDRSADALHRAFGNRAGLSRTFEENVAQGRGLRDELGAARAPRLPMRGSRLCELRLHFDVADLARPVPCLQIVDLRRVRIEGVVVEENRVP